MVKQITSLSEFNHLIATFKGLIVVDFYAEWCAPCIAIIPFINELEAKYPEVRFVKVNVDECKDIAGPRRIQSIPTFHFMLKGNLVDELKGASKTDLEGLIIKHKVTDVNPFAGAGFKLSDTDDVSSGNGMSMREARLKQFAKLEGPRKAIVPSSSSSSSSGSSSANIKSLLTEEDIDEDEALSKALELSLAEPKPSSSTSSSSSSSSSSASSFLSKQEEAEFASAAAELDALDEQVVPEHFQEAPGQQWDEEMVPVPVDESVLAQLMEMGFSDIRSRKGIIHGKTMDGALSWLSEHQDDEGIDQPYMVKKSDTIPKAPLTEEEKALRIQAVRDRVKERKAERERQDKADEVKREKERRERGQKIDETLEERQRLQRKREADKLKKEKDDAAKERLRLKQEIARDKEIRRANKGVLPSVLGVDGYNPSIIQYDVPVSSSSSSSSSSESNSVVPSKRSNDDVKTTTAAPAAAAKSAVDAVKKASPKTTTNNTSSSSLSSSSSMSASEKVDNAIQTIMRYRTGGDGGNALKLLLTFVRNVVEHPDEPKYKSINTESGAFKSKLSPLVGPLMLLRAVGFEKGQGQGGEGEEGKLLYSGEMPSALLSDTLLKLTNAESLYRQQNP